LGLFAWKNDAQQFAPQLRATDGFQVNTPEPIPETAPSSRVPKEAARLMIAILIAMSFLALYVNVQKLRRAKIEEVKVTTPHAAPSPSSEAR